MPLKALVVASIVPPMPGRDVEGEYRRFRMFMGATGSVASEVDVLHLVPQRIIADNLDTARLNQEQSTGWGFPVSVRLVPWRSREETFYTYYIKGILNAAEQRAFFGFSGQPQAEALTQALGKQYDLVLVHRLHAMLALLRSPVRPAKVVFDLGDVEHRVRLRASLRRPVQPGKLLSLAHVPAILAAERLAVARSQLTFVCSDKDRRNLRQFGISRGVTVVPNAVRLPPTQAQATRDPTLLLLGDYGYEPNLEAAERLAMRILPRVRQAVPDATLLLAGKRDEKLSAAARNSPGVQRLGFVEDLDQLYERVRIVCCPIMNGGGTRVKLIEGAAYAKPMVATRVGAEGLDFVDNQEILLRDDDEGFAAACIMLLGDDGICQRFGNAAREKVLQIYEVGSIQEQIARLLRGVVGSR